MALALSLSSRAVAQSASGDTVIVLPAPTGPHGVGVFSETWFDSSRVDTTGIVPAPRPIDLEVWYPADAAGPAPAAYALTARGLGDDLAAMMARVRPHARWRAPFAAGLGRSPVLVFSTGRSTASYDYTSLAEDLASRGYVVVGVNSPGLSRMATPSGSPIAVAPAPTLAMLQHFAEADAFLEPTIRAVADDLHFVVRGLARVDKADSSLARHVDPGRLGMFGHSNGALAAARACAEEPGCRACLGIEGTQPREIRAGGVKKPYALLISERSLGFDKEGVYRELGRHSPSHYTIVRLRGAGHNSATDLLLTRPTLFHYDLPAVQGIAFARTAASAFFDEALRGQARAGLRAAFGNRPEVAVETTFAAAPR